MTGANIGKLEVNNKVDVLISNYYPKTPITKDNFMCHVICIDLVQTIYSGKYFNLPLGYIEAVWNGTKTIIDHHTSPSYINQIKHLNLQKSWLINTILELI